MEKALFSMPGMARKKGVFVLEGENEFEKKGKRKLSGWLFVSPAAAILALFIYIPLIVAVWVSLNRWNVLRPMRYIGISNYISMFKDADFWRSLWRRKYIHVQKCS